MLTGNSQTKILKFKKNNDRIKTVATIQIKDVIKHYKILDESVNKFETRI